MIDFSGYLGLAGMDLGPLAAKPTSFMGDQREASVTLATHDKVEIGVWECTPGKFTADRSGSSEFCHFISGVVEMTHPDGGVERLGAGDAIFLPLGWRGEWHVVEHVRKLYVITQR